MNAVASDANSANSTTTHRVGSTKFQCDLAGARSQHRVPCHPAPDRPAGGQGQHPTSVSSLPDQPRAARAHRQSDRDFLTPSPAPRNMLAAIPSRRSAAPAHDRHQSNAAEASAARNRPMRLATSGSIPSSGPAQFGYWRLQRAAMSVCWPGLVARRCPVRRAATWNCWLRADREAGLRCPGRAYHHRGRIKIRSEDRLDAFEAGGATPTTVTSPRCSVRNVRPNIGRAAEAFPPRV